MAISNRNTFGAGPNSLRINQIQRSYGITRGHHACSIGGGRVNTTSGGVSQRQDFPDEPADDLAGENLLLPLSHALANHCFLPLLLWCKCLGTGTICFVYRHTRIKHLAESNC